jgi:hypothetical protein
MIRAVAIASAIAAAAICAAPWAAADPSYYPDVPVPGMRDGAVEEASCSSWTAYSYGWSPNGEVLTCVSFDEGGSGEWAASAKLVGVRDIGSPCAFEADLYGGALAQAPDGRPLICSSSTGWTAQPNGNLG